MSFTVSRRAGFKFADLAEAREDMAAVEECYAAHDLEFADRPQFEYGTSWIRQFCAAVERDVDRTGDAERLLSVYLDGIEDWGDVGGSGKGERVAKGEPRPLEPGQTLRLLAMPDLRTTRGLRDRALLVLMLDAGVRREELVALNVTSIAKTPRDGTGVRAPIPGSTDHSVVISYGKGGRERTVPLTAAAYDAIRRWMSVRPTCAHLELFVSIPRHKGQAPGPLSVTAVWRMVDGYATKAGLPDDTAPHTLRHTFASSLSAAGVPLEVGQRLLGHADPRTTLIYWKLRESAGAEAIAALEHSRLPANRLQPR